MAGNHVLLETIQLTQAASSVVFDNIPQTGYTDLKIVCSSRTSRTSDTDSIKVRFNGSSSSYTNRVLYGSGSGVASFTGSTDAIGNAYTASDYLAAGLFGIQEFYVPNYTGSAYKSVSVESVQEANTTTAEMDMIAGLWSNTAAITSITIVPNVGGNLATGSTFSLYGVAATGTIPATAPKAAGGNIVANDGTYWYHAFLTSGTFTPQIDLTCDYLVVAGGGAGGWAHAAGGGAGGLRSATAQSLTTSAYTVTIGAGGSTGTGYGSTSRGTNGSDSVFNSMTSTGGGAGGGSANGSWSNGNSGGSGGGGSYSLGSGYGYAGGGNSPSTSPSQGNNGGQGSTGPASGGGGGGAGAAGSTGAPGAGGVGSSSFSSWGIATNTGQLVSSTRYYAGGGGGGVENGTGAAGGSGGGGTGSGSTGTAGTAGTANTGGGGGGGGYSSHPGGPGGAGGSGIVIIRYAMA